MREKERNLGFIWHRLDKGQIWVLSILEAVLATRDPHALSFPPTMHLN